MRVVAVQLSSGPDVAANRAAAVAWVERATRHVRGDGPIPDLVVLPEATQRDLGPPGTDISDDAETLDGPFVAALGEAARRAGTVVVAGMFEAGPDGRAYNTLVALGPAGDLLATYRKAHLYDAFGYRESDRIAAGPAAAATVDVAGTRVGLATCYDLRFPEQTRALVDAGADVLVLPAAWVRGPLKVAHWTTLLQARAIENTAFVVGVGQCGPAYCGHSVLVDPAGVVLASLADEEGVVAATLDEDRLAEVRAANPSLANRRWQVVPR